MFRNRISKKGTLEWEYLAAIILVLLIVVVILLFSQGLKTMIIEKGKEFFSDLIPSLGQ